jgi:hypothetical protein
LEAAASRDFKAASSSSMRFSIASSSFITAAGTSDSAVPPGWLDGAALAAEPVPGAFGEELVVELVAVEAVVEELFVVLALAVSASEA